MVKVLMGLARKTPRSTSRFFALLVCLSIGVTACAPPISTTGSAELPEASDDRNSELQQASIAILNAQCLKCHGPSGSAGISNITDPKALLAQGLVTPGSPDTSRLIRVVESGFMPPRGPRMANAEIDTLRSWIADLRFE